MSRTIHSTNSKVYLSSNGISNFFKPHAAPKGLRVSNGCEELCLKSRFRWKRVSCLVRVTSWIVPYVQKTKDHPRSHTKRHEPKTLLPRARSDFCDKAVGVSVCRCDYLVITGYLGVTWVIGSIVKSTFQK